jgi:two-component system chemotaxis response regulator CheY
MGYTILVVDDSETIRAVLERTIGMTKLPVDGILSAANGRAALDMLNDNWVDIVFTDLNMPVMNGGELIDAMNDDADFRDIPVIVVSTEGSRARIEELRKRGVKGYLRKPFTPENIRDIIIETLGEWNG